MAQFCSECGARLVAGAEFCASCGASTPTQVVKEPDAAKSEPAVPTPSRPFPWLAVTAIVLAGMALAGTTYFLLRDSEDSAVVAGNPVPEVTVITSANPTETVIVTVAPDEPAADSCTQYPYAVLRSEYTNGWQVCSTKTWGQSLAINSAKTVTGPGSYSGVTDSDGKRFYFDCVSIGDGALRCDGGNVKDFPEEVKSPFSALYLVRQ